MISYSSSRIETEDDDVQGWGKPYQQEKGPLSQNFFVINSTRRTLLCAATYLGLLELRFRGGELRGGRRDGEHGFYLINRVCVYEDSLLQKSQRDLFFSFFSFEEKDSHCLVV